MRLRNAPMPLILLLAAGLAGCNQGYDPPPEASPPDTIAPAPKEPIVPGIEDPED